MNKQGIIFFAVLVAMVLVGIFSLYYYLKPPKEDLSEFAKCLSSKDAIMYGAYYCSHCQNQKRMFGSAFQYINYVECTAEIDRCERENINNYPTWEINGEKIVGGMPLEEISGRSGCSLP